jgi:voltage-gated potassium channel
MLSQTRRLLLTAGLLVALTVAGTVGYVLIEDAPWDDAFFMTVITMSTVGYGEVFDLSHAGRLYTAGLIIVGIGLVFGITGMWVRVLFEGEIEAALGERRVNRMLRDMSDHFIICGYGRFGRHIVGELQSHGEAFVIIDESQEIPRELASIQGDATHEEVLRRAGVERARALLAALPTDAENVYVTLTAKELNPELFIVSRCESRGGEKRLRRAGAARVVAPFSVSAVRMVELALNPAVVDFGDLFTATGEGAANTAEIEIGVGCLLDGRTTTDVNLRRRFRVMPVAVITKDGKLSVGVSHKHVFEAGEVLIAFGAHDALAELAEACTAQEPS